MSQPYHALSKSIHWITAIIIFGLLLMGFFMGGIEGNQLKFQVYNLHKSFGLLILILVALRVVWHIISPKPKALKNHKAWEKILSKVIHIALYGAMIAFPLSGWIMSSAAEYPVKFFGMDVPFITGKDQDLFRSARQAHGILAYVLLGALALHIAGAFKHHFIDRDETLQRMSSAKVGFKFAAFLAVIIALIYGVLGLEILGEKKPPPRAEQEKSAATQAEPAQVEKAEPVEVAADANEGADVAVSMSWEVDYSKSALDLSLMQYGKALEASFRSFEAEIIFDPDNLEESHVLVNIDVTSFDSGSEDRDSTAASETWLNSEEDFAASFEADTFEQATDDTYVAKGHVSLRGVKVPVILPFTLDIKGNAAVMDGQVTLNRQHFKVGSGESEAVMGYDVVVDVHVEATRR